MAKRYMKDEHFQELLASVKQMGDHLRGKRVPGVKVTLHPKPPSAMEVKEVRTKILNVTQEQFARIIGEGVGAVRTWEQGKRNPGGAASKLIRYVKSHPEHAKDLLVA
jgi:putative transcriptional regulator